MNDRFHNIAWPAAIVLLLLSSVGMMAAVVVAARSDGGAQVVDNYYSRAVAWDSLAALQTISAARGWRLDLDVDVSGAAILSVTDSTGAPVEDLTGEVSVRRPHLAEPLDHVPLAILPSRPGTYSFGVESVGSGIWIFDVMLRRDDLLHVAELRRTAEIQ